jgi:hypothetical protein
VRPRARAFSVTVALLLASGSCRHAPTPDHVSAGPLSGSVAIAIVNNNALDVTIYLAHAGYRERLGTVTAATKATFELAFRKLGAGRDFQLIADPLGGRQPVRTEVLHPPGGSLVTWTLESDLRRSSVVVQ